MIARLSLAVFYIITRKLLGAFYVDQKKKGLLPSTLPSEHEQWGSTAEETKTSFDVKLNITMTVICAIPYDISTKASSACYLCYIDSTATSLTFGANTAPYGYGWIAIGKQ